MQIVYFAIGAYLTIGFVYACYILVSGVDPWYVFLTNMIGGPITILYNIYVFVIKGRFPR